MTISICVTSDLHGRYDKLQQIAKQLKKLQPDIILDNGDFLQGSLTSYYYEQINPQIHPMLNLANEIGYTAAILGNHEFNYPTESIESMRHACHFPWLSANIGDFAKPFIIKEVRGKTVAIIGVTTHYTPLWDEQQFTASLQFSDALETAKHWVHYVREHEQPDYIVLCYHGGFTNDPVTNSPFAHHTGENQANDMLQIPFVDALITGHQHLQIATVVNGIPVIQPGANGNCFGRITLGQKPEAELIQMPVTKTSYPTDVQRWLQTKIGYTDIDFTYAGLLQSRIHKPKLVDFVHDVHLQTTIADISVVELMYHEHGGFQGCIKNEDILSNLSRPNTLKVLKLTGAEILDALEQCATIFSINDDGEIDFSYNVKFDELQPYLYDYWGGIDYAIDVSKPVGQRVHDVFFKGQPIQRENIYSVVMNSYRATGVEFPMFKAKVCLYESKQILPALLIEHVKQHQPLKYTSHGTISIHK